MKKWILVAMLLVGALAVFTACRRDGGKEPNQELAKSVDLDRFMGTWYVHGYTPTPLDKEAYDATETYELKDNGKIATTYRFRKGSHEGSWKTMRPTGWVHDTDSNAEWRMRFFGIFTAPYYLLYVNSDYSETVIGHPDKDMAWIMTRSPEISEADYERLRRELARRDYDLAELQRVPHEG